MQDLALLFAPPAPAPGPAMMSADLLSLVADAIICTEEDGRIIFFNRAAERSFGYSASEVIGQHVEILLPECHRNQHAQQVRLFAAGKGDTDRLMGREREVWGRRKSGEEFPTEAAVSRHLVEGRTVLTVVHRDITERKQLEEQRDAVARELDHRIRNVLSVVGSLIALSAKSAESVAGFAASLQQRLRALAATQTLLRPDGRGSIGLRELLLAEIALYRSEDGANITIVGEPIALNAAAVQPLALAFHELATNSAKYGAFSVPHGQVAVTFEHKDIGEECLLAIEWREMGGPAVKPPSKEGFGTTLIQQMIKRALRADVITDYQPEGLVCRMTLPTSRVEAIPPA